MDLARQLQAEIKGNSYIEGFRSSSASFKCSSGDVRQNHGTLAHSHTHQRQPEGTEHPSEPYDTPKKHT